MRAHLLPLPSTVFTSSLLHPNPKLPHFHFLRSINSPVAAARSRWYSDEEPISDGRFGLGPEDGDFDGGKQRTWWSDYDDEELGVDEDNQFSVLKIFRTFGWMLPAIGISLLLGTGTNAFIMALAVPLGQTVISLAFDKLWGWTVDSPKTKARAKTRKKPFSRATNEAQTTMGKQKSRPSGSYQSWVPRDGPSRRGNSKGQRFGGWDDLDCNTRAHRTSGGKEEGSQEKPKTGKLIRVGRVRERPLLLRLLVAAFPFLASWTRFLF